MNDEPNEDAILKGLLSDRETALPDPALRQRLLVQTTRCVRRRRWRNRGRKGLMLLAVYAAGWGTGQFFRPQPVHTIVVAAVPAPAALPNDRVAPAPVAPAPVAPADAAPTITKVAPAPAPEPSANELEYQAVFAATDAERAELFRRAGDRYLEEDRGDLRTALECYRNALDAAPAAELETVTVHDNWLLAALKEARKREKDYGIHHH